VVVRTYEKLEHLHVLMTPQAACTKYCSALRALPAARNPCSNAVKYQHIAPDREPMITYACKQELNCRRIGLNESSILLQERILCSCVEVVANCHDRGVVVLRVTPVQLPAASTHLEAAILCERYNVQQLDEGR